MAFQKGKSGNPGGRKKGSKNKATKTLRERVSQLLDNNFEQVVEDMKSLDAKQRVDTWVKLLEYVMPKLQRSEQVIDVSKMSDEDIDRMLEKIIGDE